MYHTQVSDGKLPRILLDKYTELSVRYMLVFLYIAGCQYWQEVVLLGLDLVHPMLRWRGLHRLFFMHNLRFNRQRLKILGETIMLQKLLWLLGSPLKPQSQEVRSLNIVKINLADIRR
ncbi:hypothetical protein O6H91_Y489400 [Diphasiastrum complanatum]|nr:hypothetical protein O6H91_Y489400 [Diphasiastrum complanatum]